MDPLRLLKRSTNLKKKQSSTIAPTRALPSAGDPESPQIFGSNFGPKGHNESANSAGNNKKRKRDEAEVTADIDFFGKGRRSDTRTAKNSRSKKRDVETTNDAPSTATDIQDSSSSDPEWLSSDECRKILREHKLKVTVLSASTTPSPSDVSTQDSKSKKKKKKLRQELTPVLEKKSKPKSLYPQPLSSFGQLRSRYGVSKVVIENIKAQGFRIPTEVQLGSLPLLLGSVEDVEGFGKTESIPTEDQRIETGVDLLTIAPTGSGKTLAFLIPVVNAILKKRDIIKQDAEGVKEGRQNGPQAIILAPTKELAHQIVKEGRKLAKGTSIKLVVMRKGINLFTGKEEDQQVAKLQEESSSEEDSDGSTSDREQNTGSKTSITKADIIVSTPLALLHAMSPNAQKAEPYPLPTVHHLVFDEADVLLDPLFRTETLTIWAACTNPSLRVSLWSATISSSIETLALSTHHGRPRTVSSGPLIRLIVGLKDTALPSITHKLIYTATEQGKLLAIRQILHPASQSSDLPPMYPPFLIFTQTILRATALHAELAYDIPPSAGGSSRLAVLHSSLPSHIREKALKDFRKGEVWVLITTDLLARGVDFRGVNAVINYDVPASAAGYVHRVGRTGRAGREGGVAITFYTKEDIPYVKNVANVIAASEKVRAEQQQGNNNNNNNNNKNEKTTNEREKEKGENSSSSSIPKWLLDTLPDVSKKERQKLKRQGGIRERKLEGGRNRISTKSGFERRVENRRRGAVRGSLARKGRERDGKIEGMGEGRGVGEEEEWSGIDDD
ncbi:MAG: RNA-dependent ATPase rok1 [Cirrosporium novae-zelandiae]|nr:MAG: RNA-dependent ATPase rok1 [Cirrosporium novae-zelandiae]